MLSHHADRYNGMSDNATCLTLTCCALSWPPHCSRHAIVGVQGRLYVAVARQSTIVRLDPDVRP
jgi:hypothetical protein